MDDFSYLLDPNNDLSSDDSLYDIVVYDIPNVYI